MRLLVSVSVFFYCYALCGFVWGGEETSNGTTTIRYLGFYFTHLAVRIDGFLNVVRFVGVYSHRCTYVERVLCQNLILIFPFLPLIYMKMS